MNLFIKANVVSLKDFKNEFFETVIAQYNERAKLVLRTHVNEKGEADTKFMVYLDDVPLINTYNLQEAIDRYNSLDVHSSKTE
mgnify:CR=1 FL=1